MRMLLFRAALIAGAATLVAACGGGDTGAANATNEIDANMAMDQPANDASAMESVANMTEEAPPVENMGNAADEAGDGAGGETSGGDTGGNVMDNIAGM